MSLLRLPTRRPLAALSGVPVRAFGTSFARNSDNVRNATSDLYRNLLGPTAAESERASRFKRVDPSRQPQQDARSPANSAAISSNSYARALVKENLGSTTEEVNAYRLRADLEQQAPRRWRIGDVYAPHDLTGVEARKWKKAKRVPTIDAFDNLALDPLKEYKNFAIMSEYMTELGRIKHSRDTGLRPRNHRRIAKAIRRAIGIGIMPSVHIHPELIKSSHGDVQ